jgi:hypothetical protein
VSILEAIFGDHSINKPIHQYIKLSIFVYESKATQHRVARFKILKRPNLAISSFKFGQILRSEKRPNFNKKFVKITKLKFRIL